jgi:hypothetical protein
MPLTFKHDLRYCLGTPLDILQRLLLFLAPVARGYSSGLVYFEGMPSSYRNWERNAAAIFLVLSA